MYVIEPEYAYLPPLTKVLNPERGGQDQAFDVWGRRIIRAEATRLLQTADEQALLSPQHGAVAITDALLTLGRVSFYRETFGNEVFLSEIMGILDGLLTPGRMATALWKLGGVARPISRFLSRRTSRSGARLSRKGPPSTRGSMSFRGATFPWA